MVYPSDLVVILYHPSTTQHFYGHLKNLGFSGPVRINQRFRFLFEKENLREISNTRAKILVQANHLKCQIWCQDKIH